MELQGQVARLRKDGVEVAAISYDSIDVLREFSDRRKITFPLLSDEGSAVIKRYGILNTTIASTTAQFGIPFPGTFVLDRDRRVRMRLFETAYQERDTVASVIAKQGGRSEVAATVVSAPHLTITTYASDQIVALGTHFSLVLDIVPAPKVHVYAPGVSGYKPIALAVTPRPLLVLERARFPEADDYFFKPLKEHVRVYQRAFRIVQDVMFDPSRPGEAALKELASATIEATLSYQACDDKVCFLPVTIPLSWTVALRPLDRERVKQD